MTFAAILVVAIGLAACGTQTDAPSSSRETATLSATPSAASTPFASPVESATPAASATPSPAVEEQTLAIVASAVNGLRLRAGPSLAAEPLIYECTGHFVQVPADCSDAIAVDAGRTMIVFAGPVAADGFDWYLAALTGTEPGSGQPGWAATPHDGDAWLVPSELECPASVPDPAAVVAMGVAAPVHCFQGRELVLEGWVVTGFGCNVMGRFEPEWLAHPCANMSYVRSTAPGPSVDPPLFLHFPAPGVTNPTLTYGDGQEVRIVGHYDDPAAKECVIEPMDPAGSGPTVSATDPAADVAVCRMRFVVTEVTAIR